MDNEDDRMKMKDIANCIAEIEDEISMIETTTTTEQKESNNNNNIIIIITIILRIIMIIPNIDSSPKMR